MIINSNGLKKERRKKKKTSNNKVRFWLYLEMEDNDKIPRNNHIWDLNHQIL